MAVKFDVSVVSASDGIEGLSKPYLPTNSAAICCASAALPPLPAKIVLLGPL